MNKKNIVIVFSVLLFLPLLASAQFPSMPALWSGINLYTLLVGTATLVLEATWIIAIAFVIIMFIIAGFKFLSAQGDPGKVKEAQDAVIWGAGGVVVIILAFSVLAIMRNTLGI